MKSSSRWMIVPTATLALGLLAACGGNTATEAPKAPAETEAPAAPAAEKEASPAAEAPAATETAPAAEKEASPAAEAPAATEAAPAAEAEASPVADAAAPAAAAAAVTVVSHDIYFEPKEFSIPADTDVTVNLPNEGAAPHNFAIDALNISVDQAAGETKDVVINAPAGEYEFYCNVPGHKQAGMVGKMTVE
jgi:uncharacterized cupredoxin-like copper-binding protein